MPTDDAQRRATEFLKELYAAGSIDAGQLDTGVAGVLAARTEAELAGLQLTGRWQLARETRISADVGSITIIVPRGVGVQIIRRKGGVDQRLDPPLPGLPLIRTA